MFYKFSSLQFKSFKGGTKRLRICDLLGQYSSTSLRQSGETDRSKQKSRTDNAIQTSRLELLHESKDVRLVQRQSASLPQSKPGQNKHDGRLQKLCDIAHFQSVDHMRPRC